MQRSYLFRSVPELVSGVRGLRRAIATGTYNSTVKYTKNMTPEQRLASSTANWLLRRNHKIASAVMVPDDDVNTWQRMLETPEVLTGVRKRRGWTSYSIIADMLKSSPQFNPKTGELTAATRAATRGTAATTATKDTVGKADIAAGTTRETFHATAPSTHSLMVRLYQDQPDEFIETAIELLPAHVVATKLMEFFGQAQQEITRLTQQVTEASEYRQLLEDEVKQLNQKLEGLNVKPAEATESLTGISFLRKLRGGSKVS